MRVDLVIIEQGSRVPGGGREPCVEVGGAQVVGRLRLRRAAVVGQRTLRQLTRVDVAQLGKVRVCEKLLGRQLGRAHRAIAYERGAA